MVTCKHAKEVALHVLGASELKGLVFLEGGLVPWIVSGGDSGRMHGDVDFSVPFDAMPALRAWLHASGFYDGSIDSRTYGCNTDRDDFGVHAVIDGVLLSFAPYRFEGSDTLMQRNATIKSADSFEALLEARAEGLVEGDFVEI